MYSFFFRRHSRAASRFLSNLISRFLDWSSTITVPPTRLAERTHQRICSARVQGWNYLGRRRPNCRPARCIEQWSRHREGFARPGCHSVITRRLQSDFLLWMLGGEGLRGRFRNTYRSRRHPSRSGFSGTRDVWSVSLVAFSASHRRINRNHRRYLSYVQCLVLVLSEAKRKSFEFVVGRHTREYWIARPNVPEWLDELCESPSWVYYLLIKHFWLVVCFR